MTAIDRRAAYYAKVADHIAADPLDFYTRAEKGRRYLASRLSPPAVESVQEPESPPINVVPIRRKRRA